SLKPVESSVSPRKSTTEFSTVVAPKPLDDSTRPTVETPRRVEAEPVRVEKRDVEQARETDRAEERRETPRFAVQRTDNEEATRPAPRRDARVQASPVETSVETQLVSMTVLPPAARKATLVRRTPQAAPRVALAGATTRGVRRISNRLLTPVRVELAPVRSSGKAQPGSVRSRLQSTTRSAAETVVEETLDEGSVDSRPESVRFIVDNFREALVEDADSEMTTAES
ncbi:MAG TPA: hypothetical protein VF719_01840, partial [Abditibacteriaceae bacterium]